MIGEREPLPPLGHLRRRAIRRPDQPPAMRDRIDRSVAFGLAQQVVPAPLGTGLVEELVPCLDGMGECGADLVAVGLGGAGVGAAHEVGDLRRSSTWSETSDANEWRRS